MTCLPHARYPPRMSVQLRFDPIRPQDGAPSESLVLEDRVTITRISRKREARLAQSQTAGTFLTKTVGAEPNTITVQLSYAHDTTVFGLHWYDIAGKIDAYVGIDGILRSGRIRYGTYNLFSYVDDTVGNPTASNEVDGVAFDEVAIELVFRQVEGEMSIAGVPSPPTPGGPGVV